jgi:hypothetical protein
MNTDRSRKMEKGNWKMGGTGRVEVNGRIEARLKREKHGA